MSFCKNHYTITSIFNKVFMPLNEVKGGYPEGNEIAELSPKGRLLKYFAGELSQGQEYNRETIIELDIFAKRFSEIQDELSRIKMIEGFLSDRDRDDLDKEEFYNLVLDCGNQRFDVNT